MAIYLNTTNAGSHAQRGRAMRAFMLAVALLLAQPLWGQSSFPAKLKAQKALPTATATPTPPQRIAEVKVPNLMWLPRESAFAVLRNLHLQPDVMADDNQPGSVVIEQAPIVNPVVAINTKVSYKVGRPLLKLEASSRSVRVRGNVHFKVILTPPATSENGQSLPVVYEFVWRRGEHSSQETTDTFTKEAPQAAGIYAAMVSTTVNDVPLESNLVEIKVEPKILITPTPTPTPSPVGSQTNPIKLILLLAVIVGTLAAAYGFHKWKTRGEPATPKVRVSIGNRQIRAKIVDPQSLKSQSLTRVRWVRGPVFSKMSPQEKIAKKKGAAHG